MESFVSRDHRWEDRIPALATVEDSMFTLLSFIRYCSYTTVVVWENGRYRRQYIQGYIGGEDFDISVIKRNESDLAEAKGLRRVQKDTDSLPFSG